MSVTAPDGTVWPAGSLRALEFTSIREFVQRAADDGYLSGKVLDYGCGTAPYRSIVEAAGGEWFGFDRAEFPDNYVGDVGEAPHYGAGWDAILCTQVLQYLPARVAEDYDIPGGFGGLELLQDFAGFLQLEHGHLVLTYPTNWPEAQDSDLCRFTKAGMERLLTEAGFTIIRHERRAEFRWHGDTFALGYGCIARA